MDMTSDGLGEMFECDKKVFKNKFRPTESLTEVTPHRKLDMHQVMALTYHTVVEIALKCCIDLENVSLNIQVHINIVMI